MNAVQDFGLAFSSSPEGVNYAISMNVEYGAPGGAPIR